jgi:hypothetical protein
MDWLQALNFETALDNIQIEMTGDWYRDPWGWRELSWVVADGERLNSFVVPRLDGTGVAAAQRINVPKENFGVRPAVVLDAIDRLMYQALTDRLSKQLVGELPVWAYGWRLIRAEPVAGRYARNNAEWNGYRSHLKQLTKLGGAALLTDIVSFFGTIPRDPLVEQILEASKNAPANRLVDLVGSWYETTGRGLPQRSAASATLAQFYLRPLDDILGYYARKQKGLKASGSRVLRWMDDIWLFGRPRLDLRDAQVAIQQAMRDIGLEMNIGKTDVLEGDELVQAALEIDHSAADTGLQAEEPDEAPLDLIIDRIIEQPETVSATTIRFVGTRMRDHQAFDRVGELADCIERVPHGAMHLARLFRDSEYWREMQSWYLGYADRWLERLPWCVYQIGTMFPSGAKVDSTITSLMADTLAGRPALPLLSLAAQRLASWAPSEARPLLREAADRESHPLARRSIALAAVHCKETRKVVRQMLSEHAENSVTLAMLEDVRFAKSAIPITSDFA